MRILLHALALLPLPVLHGIGAFIGWMMWFTRSKRRMVALTNIRACFPELPERRQQHLARRGLVHEMKSIAEIPFFWLGPKDKLLASVRETRGEELIDQALAQGKGLIVLTLHLGGFEAPGHVFASRRPITGIYKPQGGVIEELSVQGRMRTGAKLIKAVGGSVRQAAEELLRRNETLYFMPDQDPPAGRGVFVPFFGVIAHSPTLVCKLVQATGAPVIYMFGERLDWGRGYIAHYRAAPPGLDDPDLHKAVTAMNAGLEACVRSRPEQYWWGYKRFRRRPPGEPRYFYADEIPRRRRS